MRVKDVQRTANVAWSPAKCYPIYLAAGTAAQQLDASFSTSSSLELFEVNLADPALDMEPMASLDCEHRLAKLVWSGAGMEDGSREKGLLILGADNGTIQVWEPGVLTRDGSRQKPLCLLEKHSGAAGALDVNPFQLNLLASGSSDSEIFIWDLSKPENPMTPGAKSQPADNVACVAWNRQVSHILGNTFANRCVVWDLRKSEPIIKISDSMSRMKVKQVAWHPDVATQLSLCSEDDHTPVAQIWDLRYATSPIRSLERHTRGILSMAWCVQDSDLLLTCGKDNRIYCWDPNNTTPHGEVLAELPTSEQWCFDVQWCPRSPSLISSCSYDGHVSIMSLLGGGTPPAPSNKIAESFESDAFGGSTLPALPQPQAEPTQRPEPLKKPPRWLRKPVAVSFAFGGRMLTVDNGSAGEQARRTVHVQQVSTEPELVSRAEALEAALQAGQFAQYCAMKSANTSDKHEANTWRFLQAKFESSDTRSSFLQLLGFEKDELQALVSKHTATASVDAATADLQQLSTQEKTAPENSMFGAETSAFDTLTSPERKEDEKEEPQAPLQIPTSNDVEGLLARAILTGDFSSAVDLCLHEERLADALMLSIAGGHELLARTQKLYFRKNTGPVSRLLGAVLSRSWGDVIDSCELSNWRQALGLCLTYADVNEFNALCDRLGARLEASQEQELKRSAVLCYLCSGNLAALARCWQQPDTSTHKLQELVEKLMLARYSIQQTLGTAPPVESGAVSQALSEYASLLAAQGSLSTALGYLAVTADPAGQSELSVLYERVYRALGYSATAQGAPAFPFARCPVPGAAVAPAPSRQAQRSGRAYHQPQMPTSTFSQPSTYSYGQPTSSTSTQHPSLYNPANNYSSPGVGPTGYPAPSASTHSTPSYGMGTQPTATVAPSHMYPSPPASGASYPPAPAVPAPPPEASGSDHHITGGRKRYPSVGNDPYHEFSSNYPQPYMPGAPVYDPTTQTATNAAPRLDTQGVQSYQDKAPPQTGWNDPPPLKSRDKAPISSYPAPAPITTPIVGVSAPEAPGAPSYAQHHMPPVAQVPAQQPAAPAAPPPEPAVKAPLSAEFVPLQQLLDALLAHCQANAANQLTRRKLEEVQRKLEVLYDRLRGNMLSSAVCGGLLQMLDYLRRNDYASALHIHSQLVSQGNFSEISAFMPGLKALLQTAVQMQVTAQ